MRYYPEETVKEIMEGVKVDYVPTSQYDSSLCTEKRTYPRLENYPSIEMPTPWHTGTPTEEGWYLLKVKSDDEVIYDTNRLIQCLWGLDWKYVHEEILAWQKIEED